MATTDDLWDGQLVDVAFDPTKHSCDLRVSTILNGVTSTYANRVPRCFRASIPQCHPGTVDVCRGDRGTPQH